MARRNPVSVTTHRLSLEHVRVPTLPEAHGSPMTLAKALADRWGAPVFRAPLTLPLGPSRDITALCDVFTRDGRRPGKHNLSLVITPRERSLRPQDASYCLDAIGAEGLLTPKDGGVLCVLRGEGAPRRIMPERELLDFLAGQRERFFTPQALLREGYGQLSLASMETEITSASFSQLLRAHDRLAERINKAVLEAIHCEIERHRASKDAPRKLDEIEFDVKTVTLALVAARAGGQGRLWRGGDAVRGSRAGPPTGAPTRQWISEAHP